MKALRPFVFIVMALALIVVSFLLQRNLGPSLDFFTKPRQRTFRPTRLSQFVERHYSGERLLSTLSANHFQIDDGEHTTGVGRRALLRGVVIEVQELDASSAPKAPAAGQTGPRRKPTQTPSIQLWDVADSSFSRWRALERLEFENFRVRILRGGRLRSEISSRRGSVQLADSLIRFDGEVELRTESNRLLRCATAVWDSARGMLRVKGTFSLQGDHGKIVGRNLETDLTLSRTSFQPPAAPKGQGQ